MTTEQICKKVEKVGSDLPQSTLREIYHKLNVLMGLGKILTSERNKSGGDNKDSMDVIQTNLIQKIVHIRDTIWGEQGIRGIKVGSSLYKGKNVDIYAKDKNWWLGRIYHTAELDLSSSRETLIQFDIVQEEKPLASFIVQRGRGSFQSSDDIAYCYLRDDLYNFLYRPTITIVNINLMSDAQMQDESLRLLIAQIAIEVMINENVPLVNVVDNGFFAIFKYIHGFAPVKVLPSFAQTGKPSASQMQFTEDDFEVVVRKTRKVKNFADWSYILKSQMYTELLRTARQNNKPLDTREFNDKGNCTYAFKMDWLKENILHLPDKVEPCSWMSHFRNNGLILDALKVALPRIGGLETNPQYINLVNTCPDCSKIDDETYLADLGMAQNDLSVAKSEFIYQDFKQEQAIVVDVLHSLNLRDDISDVSSIIFQYAGYIERAPALGLLAALAVPESS